MAPSYDRPINGQILFWEKLPRFQNPFQRYNAISTVQCHISSTYNATSTNLWHHDNSWQDIDEEFKCSTK